MSTIAEVEAYTLRIWRSSFQYELNEALNVHLRQCAVISIKSALESALVEELDAHLGFVQYVRLPTGKKPSEQQRSGFFPRQTETEYGHIPDLRVPKLRRGNKDREWKILTRYQSSLRTLLDKSLYLYVMGLSIRDLQEALYLFVGHVLSRDAVNRVTVAVQSKMVAWQRQPITETPPILLVDGVWVKIYCPTGETWTDRSGHKRQKVHCEERVILAVLAVWPDGRHYILHYEVAEDENKDTWAAVCRHLIERGLDPQAVQMVVSDGTKGLLDALGIYLPNVASQRCTVHKVRGFERYLSYQDLPSTDAETGQPLTKEAARQQRKSAMSKEALEIFQAPTKAEAEQRLAAFVTKWQPLEPDAVHNFIWGIKRCFTFYQLDATLHALVRSTNLLERFFEEFRNKADEIGAFPNEDSCLTVFHFVMVREHAKHDRVDFAKTG